MYLDLHRRIRHGIIAGLIDREYIEGRYEKPE